MTWDCENLLICPPLEDIASSLETIQMHQVALPLGDGVNGKDDLNPEKKPIPKKQQAKFAPLTQNRLPCHLFPPFP
jgi:hypothetical protein